MTDGGKKFLWGVVAGLAAAAFIKTDTFRKGCAKVVAGGLQRKCHETSVGRKGLEKCNTITFPVAFVSAIPSSATLISEMQPLKLYI